MMMKTNPLVNSKKMLELAKAYKFAIPHINVNNMEWIQAALDAAQIARSPVILGVSMGASKYMGSYKIVTNMVIDTIISSNITVPVCLHLDHGNYEASIEALESGFSSIMFDGSSLSFEENYEKSKQLVELCKKYNASIEVEVGTIGGYEDGALTNGETADINECKKMDELGVDFLAAGVGNIHGLYPQDWKGLNFDLLKEIANNIQAGLVLHGGSGIPDDQINQAIFLGIRKINVNTECQIAFSNALQDYFKKNQDLTIDHSYDPRKYLKLGKQAIIKTCLAKMFLFQSSGKF